MNKNMKQVSCIKVLNLMDLYKHYLAYWFSPKFDFRKLSRLLIGSFLIEITFLSHMSTFPEIWIITGSVKSKKKFSDNPGHNILEN